MAKTDLPPQHESPPRANYPAPKPQRNRGDRRRFPLAVVGGLGLLVGTLALVCCYPQINAAYHWREAHAALDGYDFASAHAHLEECRQVWPDSADVHLQLAQVHRRQGQFQAAWFHLEEAQHRQADRHRLDLERLLLQAQTGAVQPVEPALRARLAGAPPADEKNIREALVHGYLQTGQVEEAFRTSSPWTERYPHDWQAQFLHGQVLEQGLRLDLAEQAFHAVLEKKPDHLGAHLHLGQVLLRRKRYPEAQPHFEAYLRAHPSDPAGLLGLAHCQRSTSPPGVTRATLDLLLAEHGESAEALVLRAQVDLEEGQSDQALLGLRRAVAVAPYDPDANQTLATVLRLLGRGGEAKVFEDRKQEIDRGFRRLEELRKAKLRSPRDVALHYEGGKILARLGHHEEAIRWLVGALLVEPGHKETRKLLAECIPKLGDPKLAEAYRPLLGSPPPEN